MLTLSRKLGERIFIGPDICVEVRNFKGSRVWLALGAPSELRITRDQPPDEPPPAVAGRIGPA